MPFTRRQSLAGIAFGVLTDVLVIALGLTVPLGDRLRDSVDNSLLMLGGAGVLITLFLPLSRMLSPSTGTRVGLALYGALSLAAVGLTDFGAWRRTGWAVKLAAAALFALSLRGLRRSA